MSVDTCNAEPPGDSKSVPNFVFILADDLGWRDTSLYGSEFYETPNIDRLARRGMMFTSAYAANPLCSPTRASILTGQYPGRLRLTTPACHMPEEVLDPRLPDRASPSQKAVTPGTRTRLPNEYFTLAEQLRSHGYTTGFFGKWHLGREPYMPESQGFDLNVGGGPYPGPPSYFSPYRIHTLPDGPEGEHITDRLTQEAIAFLQANKDRPFLLNFWHYSVHAPFQAKDPLVEKYRAKVDPDYPQRNPIMGAMIETLDNSVGRVLDEIDRLGLAGNTIIIFTSDNGGNMYNFPEGTVVTSNHPLRGGKANIYEGGVRVPLLVVWPEVTSPGAKCDAIVSSVDYYPTLLEMIGTKVSEELTIDGVSFAAALRGDRSYERPPIFCHFPHYVPATGNLPCTSVRSGQYKLIRFFADGPDQSDRHELYDLHADIGETTNLAGEMPEKVAQLDALITEHLKTTAALMPFANPAYNPAQTAWRSSDDATIAIANGVLTVTSTGSDPYLIAADSPRGTIASIRFRAKSASKGPAQIFYTTKEHPTFHRDQSVHCDIIHDDTWRTYEVKLPEAAPITGFRIDPSTASGTIQIDWIHLISNGGKTEKIWSFDG